jgi:large subunit ribosomal protein L10
MVSEKKKKKVKELTAELKKYSAIGVIDMHYLPARQLYQIRNKMRGKATIKMVKKRLIAISLKNSKVKGAEELIGAMRGEPALLLSNENPFKLARMIQESKSKAAAKAGDIAPSDIWVRAGPTSLMAGPVIGELQRAKIPAAVEDGKIAVKQDTVVAKAGETINKDVAGILAKLGVEPMEIGLNLITIGEGGYIYPKDLLFVPPSKYLDDLMVAHSRAFALTIGIGYFTPQNIGMILGKAYREAVALATEANIITSETVKPLLARADAQAKAIRALVKEPAPAEEKKEEAEKPAEEAVKTEERE